MHESDEILGLLRCCWPAVGVAGEGDPLHQLSWIRAAFIALLQAEHAKADTSGAATASCSVGLLLAAIALAVEAGDVAGLRDSVTFQECEAVAQAMEADTACDAP